MQKTILKSKVEIIMNNFNAYNDIRRYDFYLSEKEQDEWDKRSALYNTLWFYVCVGGPDIEYSETAVCAHSHLPFFQAKLKKGEWETVYHSKGKIIRPINDATFTADLMTGWWNPFSIIFDITKTELTELGKNVRNNKNFFKNWFNSEFKQKYDARFEGVTEDERIEFVEALEDFLSVVYTVGNIIPAPENPGGTGLDTWQYKLENKIIGGNSPNWVNYINTYYLNNEKKNNWQSFIESNYLKMYFDKDDVNFQKPKRFWKNEKLNSGATATLDDWTTYFKNAKKCIDERNKAIQDAITT